MSRRVFLLSAVLAALVLVAFIALYALLRLLESEKEPSP